MKRLLLIILFAVSTLVLTAQLVPIKTVRIANAATDFGTNISVGDLVFNIATKTLYYAKVAISGTENLNENLLNLSKVNTQVQIVSIAVNGNEVNAISPEWAYEHSILTTAHGITEAKYNQDDVTLADVQAATTSDFHNIGGTDAVNDGVYNLATMQSAVTNDFHNLGGTDANTTYTTTQLNQDDVTLADVQAATTNDFHNIGGTDANTTYTTTQLNQDDVTLADVQAATTNDFHNIGGTDANTQLSEATVDSYVSDNGYITDGNTGWDNSYGFITSNNDDDDIGILLNTTAVDWSVNQIDFQSPFTAVSDGTYEVNVGFDYTWAATAIESGYKTATFTHSLSEGHIGAYRIGTSSAVTLNITNLSTGDNGTIFLEMTTAPSTLTVAGYTGGVGTGATSEIVIGNTVSPTTGKHMSITYTYIGNGTSPFLYLVYGIEK